MSNRATIAEGPAEQSSDHRRAWKALLVASLLALGLLAVFGGDPALSANVAATRWLQATLPAAVALPLSGVLVVGSSAVSAVLTAGLMGVLWLRGNRCGALALCLLGVGLAIEIAMKTWLNHPPVWPELHYEASFYPLPEVDSQALNLRAPFPSGHTMRTTFLALVATLLVARANRAWLTRLAAVLGVVLVLCAAVSLVYLGWHWTGDVLGGLALGCATVAGVELLSGPRGTAPVAGGGDSRIHH